MIRSLLACLFLSLIILLHSQPEQHGYPRLMSAYERADKLYRDAEKLSLKVDYSAATEAEEKRINTEALRQFYALLPLLQRSGQDSLAFHCHFKIGTLEHYFDSLGAALRSYKQAISLKAGLSSLPDSFLFRPLLFAGALHYAFSQYDSAHYYYRQAERVSRQYPQNLQGTNRLFNSMGVMYYENGNYRQAQNYFEQAMSTLPRQDPFYTDLLHNYQINLASVLTRLEEYHRADSIYRLILPARTNRNEVLHNMGIIQLKTGAARKAITLFRQVRYENNKRIILYNDIGYAYSNLGMKDSALAFFRKALDENARWNGTLKNAGKGLTLKYMADEDAAAGFFQRAAAGYQQAIIQFLPGFNDTALFRNPSQFSGVISFLQLFQAMNAKAGALVQWHDQSPDTAILKAALETYQAAFRLADHVERTYDSDEARLFLNRIKHTAHNNPIEAALRLFDLTSNPAHLEAAYLIDQQNKASVLSLNIRENEWKNREEDLQGVFREEGKLRRAITRSSLKAANVSDRAALEKVRAEIREYEIRLGKLQQELNENPDWERKSAGTHIPSIRDLRQMLDPTTSLLSYHLADTQLLVILVSAKTFEYIQTPVDKSFLLLIDSLKQAVSGGAQSGFSHPGKSAAKRLYDALIKPLQPQLVNSTRLIIIPDDELHYLPFEVLEDEAGNFLVQKFSILYQYSTSLLTGHDSGPARKTSTLAMAPFTKSGYGGGESNGLSTLPWSAKEVGALDGTVLTDSAATRARFLELAPSFSVLHLATHAFINNEDPQRSYIAFHPGKGEFKLYAREIYDMQLDQTRLVILSACETGTGRLIKGEGLMSLSRAFAYAGCPNIITSLWKAEDQSTAYLTRRLQQYIARGLTHDAALQQAKLDLLKDPNLDPRFKQPAYWAHLVFIGQYQPVHPVRSWWWIGGILLLLWIAGWCLYRFRRTSLRASRITPSSSRPGRTSRY